VPRRAGPFSHEPRVNVNFRLLVTFLAVAEHGSFRRAASDLKRSLPAVSMQVKQLEEQLGVPLFQRTTRRVMLTAEGEQLMVTVRDALGTLERGLARIRQTAELRRGRLAIACVPTVAGSRLPAVLTEFARRHPDIAVSVREVPAQAVAQAVRRHEVDFGIGPMLDDGDDLDFEAVFTDAYCALLPAKAGDAAGDSVTLRELAGMTLLMLSSATAFRDHMDRTLRELGLSPRANYEFMQVATLVAMAEAGLGVALLPRVAVPADVRLRVVRIAGDDMYRTIAVVTLRGHAPSPSAARFVELLHASLGSGDASA
jgi:DNA-binding transcriptional LysR family regulator